MYKKSIVSILFTLPFLLTAVKPVYAVNVPDFGSCLNPQGSLVRQYSSGVHGVAGRTDRYEGSDSVYQVSSNALTQCLCPDNGQGVQTNWLKTSGLTESDVNALKSQGWLYIVTGSPWGLKDVAYLAKNSDYSCKNVTPSYTPTPTPSISETPTPTPSAGVTPTETSQPTPTTTPTHQSFVSLASTGNAVFVYGLLLTGAASLIVGMVLKKFSK